MVGQQIKTLSLFVLSFLLLVSLASAAVKQGTEYDIRHPIRLNGGITAGINCNITVIGPAPDRTLIVDNKVMTDQSSTRGYHNFTLNTTQTATKGQYDYFVTCHSPTANSTDSFSFLVNPAGIEPTDQRTESISRSIYFLFGIAIILFLAFFFTTQSVPVKWTIFIIAVMFFLMGVNTIFVSMQDEIVNPRLEDFFSGFTVISWYIYWFAAGILAIMWVLTFINTWVYKKNEQNARRYGLA